MVSAHHTGFTKRRQHLVDVVQERGARADDEHARSGQRAAMRVQQVGGAVQRDGGLACAGAALHHHGAADVGTDDLVLLALDGGDDIGHLAGTTGAQGREQRTFAGERAGG